MFQPVILPHLSSMWLVLECPSSSPPTFLCSEEPLAQLAASQGGRALLHHPA